jgi:hypothetical protein
MFMIVHLSVRVLYNHSCITTHPYKITLFTRMKGKVTIVWLCLEV